MAVQLSWWPSLVMAVHLSSPARRRWITAARAVLSTYRLAPPPGLFQPGHMTYKQPAGESTPHTPHTRVQLAGRQLAAERKRPRSRRPGKTPAEAASPGVTPRVRVDSVAGVLAVIPYLLGFHPSSSLVVIGIEPPGGQIKLAFRYDLPDPPDADQAGEIIAHAIAVLGRQQVGAVIAVGYGPGALVTPVAELLRTAIHRTKIMLPDLLRVEDGRYWSYVCDNPHCCPAEGVPFDALAHPAAAALTTAGIPAYPDRESLSRSLAPVSGPAADSMSQATQRALRRAEKLLTAPSRPASGDAMRPFVQAGRQAVRDAIASYRNGGQITDDDQLAWLTVVLADLRVRDDAWARMDPAHRTAHLRMWTDVVRRARPPYVPAPASLLAFTAWQAGDGALANIAIERALAADPGYSMALLLAEALESGLPPSAARLPMTPEEVEASYEGR